MIDPFTADAISCEQPTVGRLTKTHWLQNFVEKSGGIYYGEFVWPILGTEKDRYNLFTPPEGHERFTLHGFRGVFVFSLPKHVTQHSTSEQ